MISMGVLLLSVTGAYLLGSLCSAILISRLFHLPDPCLSGSKNPGATNVLRLSGKKYAFLVLVFDALKGFLPVLLVHQLRGSPFFLALTCFAAVLGHVYPVFFRFKGGKGVATTLGGLFGMDWMLGLLVCMTWLIVALSTRYSSLSSIVAMVLSLPYAYYFFQSPDMMLPMTALLGLVLMKHRENIVRLYQGTESKISKKKG